MDPPGVSHPARNEKLEKLRNLFSDTTFLPSPISAYVIPHDDQHMSEYLAECDKRLQYISGFTGSAGTVVITLNQALLWTDGRYFIQATEELKPPFELKKIEGVTSVTPEQWLATNLKAGQRVGGDPALFPSSKWEKMKTELSSFSVDLIESNVDLVDYIWTDKPVRPVNDCIILRDIYSGRCSGDKILEVAEVMRSKQCDLHVVSELDSIAWLLNLRGTDIPYNPVFFSFVTIHLYNEDVNVCLFIDQAKLSSEVITHIQDDRINITIRDYHDIYTLLTDMANAETTKRVWISHSSNFKLYSTVPRNKRFQDSSIVTKLKAVKNAVEAKGMVRAHIRDGYALSSFLHWLELQMFNGEQVTEIIASDKLEEFRSKEDGFRGLSFPTISSVGEHGAVIHYVPSVATDEVITTDKMYLVDSGGQYWDGTTDVTRTVHFGEPTDFEKECFTRVFKGVVSLNKTIFPANLKGNVLDSFARRALWDVGLQYSHGTGHGIGSYLCVHEGPIGVSWRPLPDDPGLDEDMFISNEPGYYKEGHFGVRIENIEHVVRATPKYVTPQKFLTLKTITLCPIQTKLINTALLNDEELKWLNDYHYEVRNALVPISEQRKDIPLKNWLLRETATLRKS